MAQRSGQLFPNRDGPAPMEEKKGRTINKTTHWTFVDFVSFFFLFLVFFQFNPLVQVNQNFNEDHVDQSRVQAGFDNCVRGVSDRLSVGSDCEFDPVSRCALSDARCAWNSQEKSVSIGAAYLAVYTLARYVVSRNTTSEDEIIHYDFSYRWTFIVSQIVLFLDRRIRWRNFSSDSCNRFWDVDPADVCTCVFLIRWMEIKVRDRKMVCWIRNFQPRGARWNFWGCGR